MPSATGRLTRIYTLTEGNYKLALAKSHTMWIRGYGKGAHILEGHDRELHCFHCYGVLKVGDTVFSKRTKRMQRRYHIDCAKAINLI